jgi:hypothetical protein
VIFNARRLRCAPDDKSSSSWEAVTGTKRDFAALLDDLFVAAEKSAETAPRPAIPFDYLAVADDLHSGRIKVSDEAAASEYRQLGEAMEAELDALLDEVGFEQGPPAEAEPVEPPSTEPDAIAAELGLADAGPADFGRLRRTFALKNHPDRVAPHMRQLALKRMQVANGLIDEAKRRALAIAKR